LCDQIAAQTGVPVAQVDTVITGLTYVIPAAVKKGDRVGLVGFGTFEPVQRRPRTARNPRTGETVKVKARKVPIFRAGIPFKDAVAGGRLAKPAALQTTVRKPRTTSTPARASGAVTTRSRAAGGASARATAGRTQHGSGRGASRPRAVEAAKANSSGRRRRT